MPIFDASTNPERVPFVEVLITLCDMAKARGVEIMLVGATARDVALIAEGYGPALRATNDVDIAVAVSDAAAYERLVADLTPARAGSAHAFLVDGITVDIVPFGGIESEGRTVIWPDGAVMNTLGFAEALQCAIELLLPGGRTLRVASIPAQAAFKVFAWADRGFETDRDAVDLRVLLHAYSFGDRLDHIYAEGSLAVFGDYDYDVRLAGGHWLGADVRTNLGDQVARRCTDVIAADNDRGRLPLAMRGNIVEDRALLAAFVAGLNANSSA